MPAVVGTPYLRTVHLKASNQKPGGKARDDDRVPLRIGSKVLKYSVISLLGRGGSALTYLARDAAGDRHVAIKEYYPQGLVRRANDDSLVPIHRAAREVFSWTVMRFLDEARTLERFRHPNVVEVMNVFAHNDTAYMVMAWEEGEPWSALLQRAEARSEDSLYRILLPVLDGLARMHAMGYVHRDIKPANIYIRQDRSPVLLDFGSAGRTDAPRLPGVPTRVTPGYSPIEQFPGSKLPQGPWTDIYSLSASVYKALSGHRPVNAVQRLASVRQTGRDPYRPVARAAHGRYSENLLRAVDHGLRLRGSDRPASVEAWREELGSYQAPADAAVSRG